MVGGQVARRRDPTLRRTRAGQLAGQLARGSRQAGPTLCWVEEDRQRFGPAASGPEASRSGKPSRALGGGGGVYAQHQQQREGAERAPSQAERACGVAGLAQSLGHIGGSACSADSTTFDRDTGIVRLRVKARLSLTPPARSVRGYNRRPGPKSAISPIWKPIFPRFRLTHQMHGLATSLTLTSTDFFPRRVGAPSGAPQSNT